MLMVCSWLSDRELLIGDQRTFKVVICGVQQGSVLGLSTLGNVEYDHLLSMAAPVGAHLVGFADDLAEVRVAKSGQLIEELLNPVLANIDGWMTSRGVHLAQHKTKAVMFTREWAYTPPRLEIGKYLMTLSKHLRYLGVNLDERFSFGKDV